MRSSDSENDSTSSIESEINQFLRIFNEDQNEQENDVIVPAIDFGTDTLSGHTYFDVCDSVSGIKLIDLNEYQDLFVIELKNIFVLPGCVLPLYTNYASTITKVKREFSIQSYCAVFSYNDKRSETAVGTLCRLIGYANEDSRDNGAFFLHGLTIVEISDIQDTFDEIWREKFEIHRAKVKYQEIISEHYLMNKFEPPAVQRLYRLIGRPRFNFTSLPPSIYYLWSMRISILVNAIKDKSCEIMELKRENLPDTPIDLVYFMLKLIPLNFGCIYKIVSFDSLIRKLFEIYSYLSHPPIIKCINCCTTFSSTWNVSIDVALRETLHINTYGMVYDFIPLINVSGIIQKNQRSYVFSFFNEYSWDEAYCEGCQEFVGWHYISCEADSVPGGFYGIIRQYVNITFEGIPLDEIDNPERLDDRVYYY